jgi:hypothetical protein
VKGSFLIPKVTRWSIGTAFLVCALGSQALAVKISGTVKLPEGRDMTDVAVIASSDKFDIYRVDVAEDGTFAIDDAVAGTYTLSVVGPGIATPDVKNVVVTDKDITQDFTATAAEPFCIVKSASPIPLDQDIDSAAFADAPEIRIGDARTVAIGAGPDWTAQGGPNIVNGRFRVKYSTAGLHLAGDINFKTPLVNSQVDNNLWNGNAIEIQFTNAPYDPTRAGNDADRDFQVIAGLGETADWWLHGAIEARPGVPVASYIKRVPKEATTDGIGGEKLRLDIPWSIFLAGGPDGTPITMPEDNALGALDIELDAADPDADRSEAVRKYQISWSGLQAHWNAHRRVPVKFCPQPPATAGQ